MRVDCIFLNGNEIIFYVSNGNVLREDLLSKQ